MSESLRPTTSTWSSGEMVVIRTTTTGLVLLWACGPCGTHTWDVRTEHFAHGADVPPDRLGLSVPPSAENIAIAFDLDTGETVVRFDADEAAIDWLNTHRTNATDGGGAHVLPLFRGNVGWDEQLPQTWDEVTLRGRGYMTADVDGVLWGWRASGPAYGYRFRRRTDP